MKWNSCQAHLLSNDGDFGELLEQWSTNALLCQPVCQCLQIVCTSLCTGKRKTHPTSAISICTSGKCLWRSASYLLYNPQFSTVKDISYDCPSLRCYSVGRGQEPHDHRGTWRHFWWTDLDLLLGKIWSRERKIQVCRKMRPNSTHVPLMNFVKRTVIAIPENLDKLEPEKNRRACLSSAAGAPSG